MFNIEQRPGLYAVQRVVLCTAAAVAFPALLPGQVAITSITASSTQAVLQYVSPFACSVQAADMNRAISIVSAAQSGGQVTVQTKAPHGLLPSAIIYLENTGVWDGWHIVAATSSITSLSFPSTVAGSAASGNVGVLVDDVNPNLFSGANLASRPGNTVNGTNYTFVLGKRAAERALDGSRYSRALQAYSRHHVTLTCGTQTFDQEFQTANIPRGDTHNEGPPVDRSNPGQYAYPTVQWSNQAQTLIDPLSGLRSTRATTPQGTPSGAQNFASAIDPRSVWKNAPALLTNSGGLATFSGPCPNGCAPLFLGVGALSIPGGATYTSTGFGNSLDWVTVTMTHASAAGVCPGNNCTIVACLTVNAVSCASGNLEIPLTATPASYTIGSGKVMDLWQTTGGPQISRVDASLSTGTVNYSAATKQLSLVTGNVFNVRWTTGSTISLAGGQYKIASVQHERLLTLSSGPGGNLNGISYSANNFGVLLWKKNGDGGALSIGYTTFNYGSSPTGSSSATPNNPCSPLVTVGGVPGYNCFVSTELYWLAADGSDLRDLGEIGLTWYSDGRFSQGSSCGNGSQPSQFDPLNGDTWYCIVPLYFDTNRYTLIQAHYMGNHSRYTPGVQLPDCALNGGVQPCVQFTIMQPNKSDSISQSAPLFNPDFAASGYQIGYLFQGGISSDGDIMFYTNAGSQDTLGWMFMYTLGDRTPARTTANSLRIVGAASTYRQAPFSWCTVHGIEVPDSGWTAAISNNYSNNGPVGTYTMTMTSPQLNATPGAPGGLSICPPNPFGVTGAICTTISVTGEPASQLNGSILQNLQVGDRITIGAESLRVLTIAGPTQFTVQRGYNATSIAPQNSSTLTMACGTFNSQNGAIGLWNYRNDPFGLNTNFQTIVNDPTILNGHHFTGDGVSVAAGGAAYNLGNSLCPSVLLGTLGECLQIRLGGLATVSQSQPAAVAINPPFAGKIGIGDGNVVDSHPGPCFTTWCMDARPLDGGSNQTLGSNTAPFTFISGQLWKISGAQALLNRKHLTTIAYVARWPLVDVSGPGSVITTGVQDSYRYCHALLSGECKAGSAPGDVYVNAPFIDYPYCYYPGIAIQGDDTQSICIGDLGAYTGNVVQYAVTSEDLTGGALRRLGPNFAKWNQFDVFWNTFAAPSGGMYSSLVRWLDGVRSDDLVTVLPPMPAADGISRNGFISIPVTVPRLTQAQSAVIEFGYVENGSAASYYCTSRQEACVATGSSVASTTPFSFEQSEAYTPAPCSNGCTIAIPALPQHVLYYRWKYLNPAGKVLQFGTPNIVITP